VEKLRGKYPPGLVDITRLPGLGPKKARRLFDELAIDSLDALRSAAEAQQLRGIRGFGPKFETQVLAAFEAGLADAEGGGRVRVLLHKALPVGDGIVEALRAHPASDRVELAGSARRLGDSVKDLDIIATASDTAALIAAFGELDVIESVSGESGPNAARARTHTGMPVDLRVVEPDQFGNLLQHFTGSKLHNVALREAAVRRGLHVSEYGILDDATGETHRCATEEEVYALLGLPWIPPELREDRGELQLAGPGRPGPHHAGRPARRPAHAHDRLRRAQHGRADGARRPRPRPGVHRASPTTPPPTASATTSPRRSCGRRSSASGRSTRRSTASRSSSGRSRTSAWTARRTTPTTCWPSSTGSSPRSTRRSAWPRRT
jgi:DNA polymerase/3'-5' exonuclease PolX